KHSRTGRAPTENSSHARIPAMNQPVLSALALACVGGLAFAAPVHAATPTANGADITLYRSDSAALSGLLGREVTVLGDSGQAIASGTLLRAGNDGLMIVGGAGTSWIRQYAGVRVDSGDFPTGSSLRLRVDAARGGNTAAVLSYPTSGLGWRAAYVATLQPGDGC